MGWGGRDSIPWFASIYLVEEPAKRVGECRSGNSHSLGVAWFFVVFCLFKAGSQIFHKLGMAKGTSKKENILISWYVWFRGEFFFQ